MPSAVLLLNVLETPSLDADNVALDTGIIDVGDGVIFRLVGVSFLNVRIGDTVCPLESDSSVVAVIHVLRCLVVDKLVDGMLCPDVLPVLVPLEITWVDGLGFTTLCLLACSFVDADVAGCAEDVEDEAVVCQNEDEAQNMSVSAGDWYAT